MNLYSLVNDAKHPAEVMPDEAGRTGAFTEDALSEQDAAESRDALEEIDGAMTAPAIMEEEIRERPCFMDEDDPNYDYRPPSHIRTASARDLFDIRPGETWIPLR